MSIRRLLDPSLLRRDNGFIVVAASLANALAFLCIALASRNSLALDQPLAAATAPQALLAAQGGGDASVPDASSVRFAPPSADQIAVEAF